MRFRQHFVQVQFSKNLSAAEVKCLVEHWETADLFLLAVGDLYGDIGQLVKSDLMVQTWGCQPGYDRSSCIEGRSRLFNIKTIKTNLGEWANTKDHSKWCIATNLNINLVCIADMNRSTSQYQRYGGALCINNPVVKQIFGSFVKNVEDCRTINLNAPNADCDDVDY